MNKFKKLTKIISDFIFVLKKRSKIILRQFFFRKKSPFNILDYSIKFMVNECIKGDYYEFVVFRGENLIEFNKKFNKILKKRLKNKVNSNDISQNKRINLKEIKFHAFDSFEGLPSLTKIDQYSLDFKEGQYKCSKENFILNLKSNFFPIDKLICHKGWFSKTCTHDYFIKNNMRKASIVWIDCDLYSSAKDVFKILFRIIQDGTIIIIDDWFSNKGSPYFGLQKAFYEWQNSDQIKYQYNIHPYIQDSWKRNSFIVNKIPKN